MAEAEEKKILSAAHTVKTEEADFKVKKVGSWANTHYRIASRILNTPLMIEEGKLEAILMALNTHGQGVESMFETVDIEEDVVKQKGNIAIIPIHGTLVNRSSFMNALSGMISYEDLANNLLEMAADDSIKGIILDMDSGGGEATGNFEIASLITEITEIKPVVAVVNGLAASAAYMIASATEHVISSESSFTGSIGTRMVHADYSKQLADEGVKVTHLYSGSHKVDLNPHEPISDSARAEAQSTLDDMRQLFASRVSEYRGMPLQDVLDTEARVYMGSKALDVGLIDEIGGLQAAINYISKNTEETPDMNEETISAETDVKIDAKDVITAERDRMKAIYASEHGSQELKEELIDTEMSTEKVLSILEASSIKRDESDLEALMEKEESITLNDLAPETSDKEESVFNVKAFSASYDHVIKEIV